MKSCARGGSHTNSLRLKKQTPSLRRNVMLIRFKEKASNSLWDIVTDDETSIYCYDPKTKQQSTVWMYRVERKPTKVARERSASKQVITSFFNKTGHVATVALENCRTANSD
ncbi:hypothetical protein EVAR_53116_1 [Eumeta japonica]|uniref:Mariner Mos1 transposase n=1 Tax=Eumeta variegata TaxID=151549 RepID=A0A4C1Y8J3_EUMVA|nr:hypothetical protein EVAR_53116_1 [Eumeta japonica]